MNLCAKSGEKRKQFTSLTLEPNSVLELIYCVSEFIWNYLSPPRLSVSSLWLWEHGVMAVWAPTRMTWSSNRVISLDWTHPFLSELVCSREISTDAIIITICVINSCYNIHASKKTKLILVHETVTVTVNSQNTFRKTMQNKTKVLGTRLFKKQGEALMLH